MLVTAPERWDEACFAVPAVRALTASGLGTGILCRADQREFWETLDGLTVIDFPARAKPKVVAAEISGNWQASLAWEAGVGAEACKIAHIPRRLGVGERQLKKLLTHPLEFAVGPLEHRVRHYLAAVEELGMETERSGFFAPADLGIELLPDSVLLYPESDFGPSHEWPVERWVEIGRRLIDRGKSVTVAGHDQGQRAGKILAEGLGTGFTNLIPEAGALPLLAAQGLVIAADGSMPHLAAHAGATCITLFGPNDPAWKRPLGRRHSVVWRHVACAPCFLSKCPLDRRCQSGLEVDRVWRAVKEKLKLD